MDLSTGLWIYLEFRIPFFSICKWRLLWSIVPFASDLPWDPSRRPQRRIPSSFSTAWKRRSTSSERCKSREKRGMSWGDVQTHNNAHLCVVIHTNIINHILYKYSLLSYIYLYFTSCSLYHFILMYQLSDVHQKDWCIHVCHMVLNGDIVI